MTARLAAAVAVLLAVLLPATAQARDATVTSFDGTAIAVHLLGAPGGGQAATVLDGSAYATPGTTDAGQATDPDAGVVGAGALRDAGFNVVTWDPRGFGKSGGTATFDGDAEARDVSAIVDWLARQPEARLDAAGDPRVGMSGASYGGGIQWRVAAIDPRIDAIAPALSWYELGDGLIPDSTPKAGWGAFLAATGGLGGRVAPIVTKTLLTGTGDGSIADDVRAFLADRGPGALVDRVRAPALIVQGTVDTLFGLRQSVDAYAVLRKNRVPRRLLWFCGGHGACLTPYGPRDRVQDAVVAWMRRYLDGDTTASTGAAFDWVDQAGETHGSAEYPPASGPTLTAQGSGTLALQPLGGSGPVTTEDTHVPSASASAPYSPTRAAAAVNVAVPVDREAAIVSAPQLTIDYRATGTTREARVFAQLVDDATGSVLDNQVTPIPVVLDGAAHTVTRPLEIPAALLGAGHQLTLQIVAQSTTYALLQRTLGSVAMSRIALELPTADLAAPAPTDDVPACARVLTIHPRKALRSRVRAIRAVVGGHTVARGRRTVKVHLAPPSAGRVTVRLRLTLRGGHVVTDTRRYRVTCGVRAP